jgi:hypothetical protein
MTNNQPSATKSILYAIATLLAILGALFAGVVTAADSMVPGAAVGLILMVLAFAGGYAIGHSLNRRRSPNKNSDWFPVGFGVLALGLSICGLICGYFAYWMYEVTPVPSPAPYPDATVKQRWDNFRETASLSSDIFEYTVERSLNDMEQYYRGEMQRYCAPGWEFKDTNALCTDGYSICRTAKCEIVKPLTKGTQFFEVYLRVAPNSSKTNIIYFEITQDL